MDAQDKALVAAAQELAVLLDELKITERELTQAGNPNADVFTVCFVDKCFCLLLCDPRGKSETTGDGPLAS